MFKICGWTYNLKPHYQKNRKFQLAYYWSTNFLLFVILIQSFTSLYLDVGNPEKLLDFTEVILCIGFIVIMFIRSYNVIYSNRKILTEMIDELDEIIPKLQHVQQHYQIPMQCRHTNNVSIMCSVVYMSLLSSFDLMPMIEKLAGSIRGLSVPWQLPFKFYFPFDATEGYVYPFIYIYLSFLCYKCAIEVLVSDLLFCNLTSVVSMNLEIISNEISKIEVKYNQKAMKKVKMLIKLHQNIIMISDKLEMIYSFSLLADIMASTFITCLAAFNALVRLCQQKILRLFKSKHFLITVGRKKFSSSEVHFVPIYVSAENCCAMFSC
jgi:hypothetical protein